MASVAATRSIVRGLRNLKMLYVMDDGSYGEWWSQVVIDCFNREVQLERDSNKIRRIKDTWVPATLVFRDGRTTDIQSWDKHRYMF